MLVYCVVVSVLEFQSRGLGFKSTSGKKVGVQQVESEEEPKAGRGEGRTGMDKR